MSQRLFDAILDANHRALAGDTHAGLHPAEYAEELPLVALTCVDARLNALLPQVLGVLPEHFVWLRNAGNIITGSLSSTMRSLALACAVKGGKEIAVIGHTNCQVGHTTTMQLLDRFHALGIERQALPDNLTEFFGLFGSERQNVLKSVEFVRASPLIGAGIPVQGLLVDIETGKLEWLVNGYETLGTAISRGNDLGQPAGQALDALKPFAGFDFGHMTFPETKIGEVATKLAEEIAERVQVRGPAPAPPPVPSVPASSPPKIPMPPPLRPKVHIRRNAL
jgi:carbonic anhydrase